MNGRRRGLRRKREPDDRSGAGQRRRSNGPPSIPQEREGPHFFQVIAAEVDCVLGPEARGDALGKRDRRRRERIETDVPGRGRAHERHRGCRGREAPGGHVVERVVPVLREIGADPPRRNVVEALLRRDVIGHIRQNTQIHGCSPLVPHLTFSY